jgi:hypothetical protein
MNCRALVVFLAVLLAAGCYFTRAEQTETRTWPSTGITGFNAHTENGAVTVNARADTGITALITRSCLGSNHDDAVTHIADIRVTDSTRNGTVFLVAEMPHTSTRNYECEYDISTPAATALILETSNGAVGVTGITGDVTARTSNGAVSVTNTAGAIDLQTSNGAVTLTGTAGPATIITSSGRITAAPHRGYINAQTSNGAIDCDLARFDTTDAAVLYTSNGRVTVSLPADASVTFDAKTSNGTIRISGFTANFTLDDAGHKHGTIGTGRATLTITTSNGDVTVRPR